MNHVLWSLFPTYVRIIYHSVLVPGNELAYLKLYWRILAIFIRSCVSVSLVSLGNQISSSFPTMISTVGYCVVFCAEVSEFDSLVWPQIVISTIFVFELNTRPT